MVPPELEKTVPIIHQVVDPVVSQKKFDIETAQFCESGAIHRSRGIFVLDCRFPDIKIAFCAPQIKPIPIIFAVNINFTNYDLEPLSVKFIHPLNFHVLGLQELGHPFLRNISIEPGKPNMQPLALGLADQTAFICLPGIREYHQHPDHSNDPWLAHRGKGGEGTLGFIIDKLWEYGILALNGFNIQLNATIPQLQLGIDINKVPS